MRIYTTRHHMVTIPRGKGFEGTSEYADPLAEPGVRVIWFGFSDFRNPLKDEFNFSELDPKATTFLKGKTVTPVTSEAGAIEYLQTGNLGVFK